MKYTLLIALFAAVAIASAFPSDAETAKAEETETKVEATETKAEGTADDAMAAAKETLDAADQADKCEPGSLFKNDCNTCTCPPSGLRSAAGCTLKLCLETKPSE
ncbi:hypothetical protein RUM43_001300 [Polyplax serrata]|uniref:Pacifastin domain-containing protein n=1 Tax=Polyplax serrata TaxID=468196 RepID=A0AAN8XQ08_POLSC